MKIIVDKVEDIDDDDTSGRTAMLNAAYSGRLNVVEFLLEQGASLTRVDKHNCTPLFFSLLGKSEETVRFLLEKMIEQGKVGEINLRTIGGRSCLRQASWRGFTTIVEILLEKMDPPELLNWVDLIRGRT